MKHFCRYLRVAATAAALVVLLLVLDVLTIVSAVPVGSRCSKSVIINANGVNSTRTITSEYCDEGSYCPAGTADFRPLHLAESFYNCTAFILPGQQCRDSADLPCSPGQACEASAGPDIFPCSPGNYCNSTSLNCDALRPVVKVLLPVGSACTFETSCDSGICTNDVCAARLPLLSSCSFDPDGHQRDGGCLSGYCLSQMCTVPLMEGDTCDATTAGNCCIPSPAISTCSCADGTCKRTSFLRETAEPYSQKSEVRTNCGTGYTDMVVLHGRCEVRFNSTSCTEDEHCGWCPSNNQCSVLPAANPVSGYPCIITQNQYGIGSQMTITGDAANNCFMLDIRIVKGAAATMPLFNEHDGGPGVGTQTNYPLPSSPSLSLSPTVGTPKKVVCDAGLSTEQECDKEECCGEVTVRNVKITACSAKFCVDTRSSGLVARSSATLVFAAVLCVLVACM